MVDIPPSNDTKYDLPIALKVPLAVMDSKIAKNIQEMLAGHLPNLNEKEFIICKMIIQLAHHDLGYGCQGCLVPTTAGAHRVFHNEKEVEDIIEELIHKGVVIRKLINRSTHNISLNLNGDIQDDIVGEMNREFVSAIEQACAIDKNIKVVKYY